MFYKSGYSKDLETKMHQTIKKVSNDFENLKYNTAIAAMMALINDFYKKNSVTRDEYRKLLDKTGRTPEQQICSGVLSAQI